MTGDRKQETGHRRKETGDRRQETGDMIHEKRNIRMRQETEEKSET